MEYVDPFLKQIRQKRLLVVFPHPDDETFMAGGLILRAKSLGYDVRVVCLTKGERGQNFRLTAEAENLAEVRAEELGQALKALGVDKYDHWDFPDGGLAKKRHWLADLYKVLVEYRPGVVVSYGHSGVTGHPDHIALGVELFNFIKRERLPTKLLWPIWPGVFRQFMVHPEVADVMAKPDLVLDLTQEEKNKKLMAVNAHQSQLGNWSQLEHKILDTLYYQEFFAEADFAKDYTHRFVNFKID